MNKISSTGRNLSAIISTDQSLHSEWMTFACWYSINKNLPDAKVAVIFPRANNNYMFSMLNRCHIPYTTFSTKNEHFDWLATFIKQKKLPEQKYILLDEPIMCIRELSDETLENINSTSEYVSDKKLCCDCRVEEYLSFVKYNRLGDFNLDEWIKTEKQPPFHLTEKFKLSIKTINEFKVINLWEQMATTYDHIKNV
jgi:hypothetical protein